MRQLARIVAETHGEIAVAHLEGEVDMSNADALGRRLRGLVTNRSEALVVDLAPTSYLDSSGITLLFELAAELGQRQQELHLVVPDGAHIARVISISGLDRAAPTHVTLEAALERLGAPPG